METGSVIDGACVVADAEGGRRWAAQEAVILEGRRPWQSTRTFQDFPTAWQLSVPELELNLQLEVAFEDQELLSLLSMTSLWQGRVRATGGEFRAVRHSLERCRTGSR